MVSKLATVRAAAITAAAVLGAGAAAAAATGSLSPASSSSSHGSSHQTTGSNPTSTTSTTNGAANSAQANPNLNNANPLKLPATGPANFHAVIGLCRAFLEHNSTTPPGSGPTTSLPENNSTAFTDLRKDAGNGTEASVAATVLWCNTNLARLSPGSSGAAQNGTAPSGKPANPDNSGTHSSTNVNSASHGGSPAGTSTANSASGGASSSGSAKAGGR